MSKWENVIKFDFSNNTFLKEFYKISDFNFFVDSEFGSDLNDGLTPETAYKTLSKLYSSGSIQDNMNIAISGVFTDNFNLQTKYTNLNFIGVSGHNGKAIISNINYISYYINYQNVIFKEYKNIENGSPTMYLNVKKFISCIINTGVLNHIELYNSIIINPIRTDRYNWSMIAGKNSTVIVNNGTVVRNLVRVENIHITNKNGGYFTNPIINCLFDTNLRYYTDNTETTPADLYIDSANGNYGIKAVFDTPIWDKTEQKYITENPLYKTGTEGKNIGAGLTSININASNNSLKSTTSGGEATYNNMQSNESYEISRVDDSTAGTVFSGIVDLGESKKGIQISAISTYGVSNGVITERLQESTPSLTQGTDFYIQFGETVADCNAMQPILCEYGKPISYSKSGSNIYGNSDSLFVPTKKVYAKFRYFKIQVKAQTIS